MISLDLTVLFTSSSKHMYGEKTPSLFLVKMHHKTSPGIRNESEHYRIDFGQPSSCSECSPAGQHYTIPSWSTLKDLHISQAFFNHHVLLVAATINLLPHSLNHTSNQEDFGYAVLTQHTSWGEFSGYYILPKERRDGPWARAYLRTQHCTDTQRHSINSCLLL